MGAVRQTSGHGSAFCQEMRAFQDWVVWKMETCPSRLKETPGERVSCSRNAITAVRGRGGGKHTWNLNVCWQIGLGWQKGP